MKSSLRSAADFIFVMYLSIYLTGCRSVESYRPYDPDLDSYALENIESVTLTDGTVINLNEYSNLKIIKDAKSRNAISYERYDTAWDNSH